MITAVLIVIVGGAFVLAVGSAIAYGNAYSAHHAKAQNTMQLTIELSKLQNAFNDLFDAVAEDLGYEASRAITADSRYWLEFPLTDPRRLAKTVTAGVTTVSRKPMARRRTRTRGGKK